jgi:pyruvate kinase
MAVLRRTKIVATLGPSTSSPERIEALVRAGLDVARLNFSHGNTEDHRQRAQLVREAAARQGRFVALMGDLQGPKIRIARFIEGKIVLRTGGEFTLSNSHPYDEGNDTIVGPATNCCWTTAASCCAWTAWTSIRCTPPS